MNDNMQIITINYNNGAIKTVAPLVFLAQTKDNLCWQNEVAEMLDKLTILLSQNHRYFGRQLETKPIGMQEDIDVS